MITVPAAQLQGGGDLVAGFLRSSKAAEHLLGNPFPAALGEEKLWEVELLLSCKASNPTW